MLTGGETTADWQRRLRRQMAAGRLCFVFGSSGYHAAVKAALSNSGRQVEVDLADQAALVSPDDWLETLLLKIAASVGGDDAALAHWRAARGGRLFRWQQALRRIADGLATDVRVVLTNADRLTAAAGLSGELLAAMRAVCNRPRPAGDGARVTFCLVGGSGLKAALAACPQPLTGSGWFDLTVAEQPSAVCPGGRRSLRLPRAAAWLVARRRRCFP